MATIELVKAAIEPQREAAVSRAVQVMKNRLEAIKQHLEDNGWDMDKAFPYPNSGCGRVAYKTAVERYTFARRVTKSLVSSKRPSDPWPVRWDDEAERREILCATEMANANFDEYAAKLAAKIGDDATAIECDGSFIWAHSILTVTHTDGGVSRWKTQMIVNVSCLGKLFNQWPTRKIK